MKWAGLAAAIILSATALGGAARAAVIYDVSVDGLVTSSTDPGVHDGDYIHFTAQFTSAQTFQLPFGYSEAGLYGYPMSGPVFWSLTTDSGLYWKSKDELEDGGFPAVDPITFGVSIADPAIIFDANHVLGLSGYMYPIGHQAPLMFMGSTPAGAFQKVADGQLTTVYVPAKLSDKFAGFPGGGAYGDNYPYGFSGVWDFADSTVTVTAVPEPAAWLLATVGFGMVGYRIRRTSRSAKSRLKQSAA